MIRLRQLHGAHTGREVESDAVVIKLGRLPDSDIAFDPHADRDASGLHAELHRTATGYQIVDQKSRNGTWVNGDRITQQELKVGDEIECGYGGPRLRVESIGTASLTDAGTDKSWELTPAGQAVLAPAPENGRGLFITGIVLFVLGLASIIAALMHL